MPDTYEKSMSEPRLARLRHSAVLVLDMVLYRFDAIKTRRKGDIGQMYAAVCISRHIHRISTLNSNQVATFIFVEK